MASQKKDNSRQNKRDKQNAQSRVRTIDAKVEWSRKKDREKAMRLEVDDELSKFGEIGEMEPAESEGHDATVRRQEAVIQSKRRLWAWGATILAIVFATLVVLGGILYQHLSHLDTAEEFVIPQVAMQSEMSDVYAAAEREHDFTKQVWALMQRLEGTKTLDEIQDIIVFRDQQELDWLNQHYKKLVLPEPEKCRVVFLPDEAGVAVMLVRWKLGLQSEKSLIFVQQKGDEIKWDWKASFAYGDIPFHELKELAPKKEVKMRALLSKDNFYNSNYPEDEWQCFRYSEPFGEEVVWVYAVRGSVEEEWLQKRTKKTVPGTVSDSALMVYISLVNGGSAFAKQLELTKVLNAGWVAEEFMNYSENE